MIQEKVELTGKELEEYWDLKRRFDKKLKSHIENREKNEKLERRFHWFAGGMITGIILLFLILICLKKTVGLI